MAELIWLASKGLYERFYQKIYETFNETNEI